MRAEVGEIRAEMPDKEMFLTAEEERLLEESYENEKAGDLISGKTLRAELGI